MLDTYRWIKCWSFLHVRRMTCRISTCWETCRWNTSYTWGHECLSENSFFWNWMKKIFWWESLFHNGLSPFKWVSSCLEWAVQSFPGLLFCSTGHAFQDNAFLLTFLILLGSQNSLSVSSWRSQGYKTDFFFHRNVFKRVKECLYAKGPC